MLADIIGLILWTGIIFTFCFLSYRRKVKKDSLSSERDVKRDELLFEISSSLSRIEDLLNHGND